jgi:nickel transport protein
MFTRTFVILLLLLTSASAAPGHQLEYEITRDNAVVVRFYFADGTPFSYESYEIFREGEDIIFQSGRTDDYGRLSFLPDRDGNWRIRTFSEDGHGLDITVPVDDQIAPQITERSWTERYARLIVGVAFIFGFFGIISLFLRRKKK